MNGTDTHDFDSRLRARHSEALCQLSSQVRAQLSQRRIAAIRGRHAPRKPSLRFAVAGFAALCALAFGLRLQLAPTDLPATASATFTEAPLQTAAITQGQRASGSAAYAEDPDFYAWLGSNDVRQLAME